MHKNKTNAIPCPAAGRKASECLSSQEQSNTVPAWKALCASQDAECGLFLGLDVDKGKDQP